jgi:hypothetical protein
MSIIFEEQARVRQVEDFDHALGRSVNRLTITVPYINTGVSGDEHRRKTLNLRVYDVEDMGGNEELATMPVMALEKLRSKVEVQDRELAELRERQKCFDVICDESNNPPESIEQGILNASFKVCPLLKLGSELAEWFNKHTNATLSGPTKPPEPVEGGTVKKG